MPESAVPAKEHSRPEPACGDFLVDRPVYFVSRRSLNSSRKAEFGASSHCRKSIGDVEKNCSQVAVFQTGDGMLSQVP
jgi:hypothetical protein